MSRKKMVLRDIGYPQMREMKPNGLWYAFGDSWLNWVEGEMPEWRGDYLYEVKVNSSKILRITSVKEIAEFTKKHSVSLLPDVPGLESVPMRLVCYIDWPTITKEYDAIEITPYLWEARYDYMWYYGWDVASGCVWNTKAVELVELDDKVKTTLEGNRRRR